MNITCPINNLSYGIVSTNILDELSKLNKNYRINPIAQFDTNEFSRFIPKCINFNEQLDLLQPSVKIWHEHGLFQHVGKGPRIGFPIFEKNKFNQLEVWNIKHQDLVLVCSQWAKSIVEPINKNVHVCPLGVDENFFNVPYEIGNKVVFYTQGKREIRKGHNYLHKVFHKAFSGRPEWTDVELWMFTQNVFDEPEETRAFHLEYKSLLGDKVKFFPFLPKQEMLKWLAKTHIGVFLSRAEGWNLPLIESIAMGKDVVATYYSGHTEYLPEDLGIKPIEFEPANDGKWFHGNFEWMKIEANEDEIVEKLRYLYNKRLISSEPGNNRNQEIARKFTWNRTTKEVLSGVSRA